MAVHRGSAADNEKKKSTFIMKKTKQLLTLAFAAGCGSALSGSIYIESFTGQNDQGAFGDSGSGITEDTSSVDWNIDISGAGLDGDSTTNDWRVINEEFVGQDMGGVASWFSPSIDISGVTEISEISFDIRLTDSGANASSEGFSFSYSLDGGSNVDVYTTGFDGDDTDGTTAITSSFQTISTSGPIDVSGNNTLDLTFTADINGADDGYIIDNVTVVPEPSVYAAALGLLALGFVAYRRRR